MLCLRSPLLSELGFRHGFSLRAGGASSGRFASLNMGRNVGDELEAVRENHRRVGEELGYDPELLCEVNQVHGAAVERVSARVSSSAYHKREADALVCAERGRAVAVRTADCAAVLLADPVTGAVAAVHAGWRGVVAGVVESAARMLCELHDSPIERLAAAVFPCIGPEAFEVGEDVARQLAAAAGSEVVRAAPPGGKLRIDLQRAVARQLGRSGLRAERVELVLGCTFSEPNYFYSHRRDQGVTGRHLAVILPRC